MILSKSLTEVGPLRLPGYTDNAAPRWRPSWPIKALFSGHGESSYTDAVGAAFDTCPLVR